MGNGKILPRYGDEPGASFGAVGVAGRAILFAFGIRGGLFVNYP
jgi:hypothetical protein